MKEERLIGNSGIPEVRQQCLNLLEEIRQSAGVLNDYFAVEDNQEFIDVILDEDRKVLFGARRDGVIYIPFLYSPSFNKELSEFKSQILNLVSDISEKLVYLNEYFEDVENLEYLRLILDSDGNILEGITRDGRKVVNLDTIINGLLSCSRLDINGSLIYSFNDVEGRKEIVLDDENRIISYRDSNGIKHEEVGLKTPQVLTESLPLPKDAQEQVEELINGHLVPKDWYLPKFGKVNIKKETFYLTSDQRWSTKNDIVCIQMLDDTAANAWERRTLSFFYIKSTLTPLSGGGYDRTSVNANSVQLEFFPAKEVVESDGHYYVKKITKVGGNFYFTSTLVATESGGTTVYAIDYLYGQVVSVRVNYSDASIPDQTTLTNAIEVTQVIDAPQYKAWPVSKEFEHYCLADIDFGSFYKKNNVPVGIKYQGSGSTRYVKRGLRLTFYKNATYAKKEKVKIGEMVRLSGYNMKSYYQDITRVNDPILSNLFIEMWESRGKDCYPWNKDNLPYNGATGFIKSFPIETRFGGEFFGLQFFSLKKDEKNYMLDGDDDSSGIFAIGDVQQDFYQANHTYCADEMMDEMSQETADALDELFKYTTGFVDGTIEIDGQQVEFTNDMLEEHIDIESWIDYWIGCQVFVMWDSTFHNAVMYSGRDKKKFYLFFYDLDMAINAYQGEPDIQGSLIDIMAERYTWVTTPQFWIKFTSEYKDNILNRYAELRKNGILTVNNISSIYRSYIAAIPEEVLSAENTKWGGGPLEFETSLEIVRERLEYLDSNVFYLKIN